MSGIFALFGSTLESDAARRVAGVLDPYGTGRIETIRTDRGLLAAYVFPGLPSGIKRSYDDGRFAAVLGGDVVAEGAVPWDRMISPIRDGRPGQFPELPGFFALVIHDRDTGRVWVVSDTYCFYPVFYRITAGRVDVTSHQGAFAAVGPSPEFNPAWLWELLYYSNPIGPTGLYLGVVRPPLATVTEIDPNAGTVIHHKYGRDYRQSDRPLTGAAAIDRVIDVFRRVIPQYYGSPGDIAHALTGGWDCRTLSGLIPEVDKERVTTYTYGLPGSNDIVESRRISKALGIPHSEIIFDGDYIKQIPMLACESVFQAGGLENINRAYIPYTYHKITSGGTRNPIVMSGIGADALFRGHVPTPNGLSYDMTTAFRTGRRSVDEEFFRGVFGERYDTFREYIESALDWYERTYGGFGSVQNFFSYEMNEALPRYFNGECLIAGHCSSLRVPYLHPEVMQLACDIEYSVMKLWKYINDDVYKESFVQAALIDTNPRLRAVPINGIPMYAYSCRNKTLFRLIRIIHKTPRKIVEMARRKQTPQLEDWDAWYRTVLSTTFTELLGPDARVRRHLDGKWVDEIRDARTQHWLKLVTTAEITLRLVENGWKRFWQPPFGGSNED